MVLPSCIQSTRELGFFVFRVPLDRRLIPNFLTLELACIRFIGK
jgi:hypothetical protein